MGVFSDKQDLFTTYRGTLQFRDKLVGGIPGNPRLIEGWIAKNAGLSTGSEENHALILRTLRELGEEIPDNISYEDLMAVTAKVAKQSNSCMFKRDEEGLYIEGRQLKAALKESTNVLYAGERWGATKKGPRSYLTERVFVDEDRLHLGVNEPDPDLLLMIGQVSGPTGTRSVLGYYETVTKCSINFTVRVVKDLITDDQWAEVWTHAEANGLGALRSQGHGVFEVVAWDKVDGKKKKK